MTSYVFYGETYTPEISDEQSILKPGVYRILDGEMYRIVYK